MNDETESLHSRKAQQAIHQYDAIESLLKHISGECSRSRGLLDYSDTDAEIDYHGKSSFRLLNALYSAMIDADFHLGVRCALESEVLANATADSFWCPRYTGPKVFERDGSAISVEVEVLEHFGLANNQVIDDGLSVRIEVFRDERHRNRHNR